MLQVLLENFISAYLNTSNGSKNEFDSLLMYMLPEKHHFQKDNIYDSILHICNFVSMLTDGKVKELYDIIVVRPNRVY